MDFLTSIMPQPVVPKRDEKRDSAVVGKVLDDKIAMLEQKERDLKSTPRSITRKKNQLKQVQRQIDLDNQWSYSRRVVVKPKVERELKELEEKLAKLPKDIELWKEHIELLGKECAEAKAREQFIAAKVSQPTCRFHNFSLI